MLLWRRHAKGETHFFRVQTKGNNHTFNQTLKVFFVENLYIYYFPLKKFTSGNNNKKWLLPINRFVESRGNPGGIPGNSVENLVAILEFGGKCSWVRKRTVLHNDQLRGQQSTFNMEITNCQVVLLQMRHAFFSNLLKCQKIARQRRDARWTSGEQSYSSIYCQNMQISLALSPMSQAIHL